MNDDDDLFPFYELRYIMRVLSHEGDAPRQDWQTARGMAKEIFERWNEARLKGEQFPPDSPSAKEGE